MQEVLKPQEAADYLRITYFTLMRLANEGQVGKKVGKRWRFHVKDLERFVCGVVGSGAEKQDNEPVQKRNTRTN